MPWWVGRPRPCAVWAPCCPLHRPCSQALRRPGCTACTAIPLRGRAAGMPLHPTTQHLSLCNVQRRPVWRRGSSS